jgi:hypothetical protein
VVDARARISERDTLEAEADARDAVDIARQQGFFHWPLEYPEVFGRARPGFDVLLSNPPWEKLKVERHDFFQFRIPGLKFVSSAAQRETLIQELIERDPSAQLDYEATIARIERLKKYFQPAAGNYSLHGGGDADLFKAFCERFLRLARIDGSIGCVLPRGLLSGAGTAPLRRELFQHWQVISADVLWNRRVWAFPDVFHRTRMTLLAARRRNPGNDPVIPSAGPLGDAARFALAPKLRVHYHVKQLARWSRTLELPSLPDPEAGRIFEAMLRHRRFDDAGRAWLARPYCELHSTADKDLYNESGRGWPVWKGRTFERYEPDISAPVYWAEPEPTLERLQEKRLGAKGVFDGFPTDFLADPATLPAFDCRIVFRDVSNPTNRRTMTACLAPPRIFAIHDAPQLVWPRGDAEDTMRLLAILNSLPFDWLLRRRVETHVTFGILNSLPIPDTRSADRRLVELAGRLSFVDDRYRGWAARIGLDKIGRVRPEERAEIEAEIDVLVARAYGLSEPDLVLIFNDFVDAALPDAQRQRILRKADSLT